MKKITTLLLLFFASSFCLKAQTGQALKFNTGNTVSFPAVNSIPIGNSNYTIELWIKPVNQNGGFIGWGNYFNANQINAFRFGPPGTLYAYWWANDLAPSTAPVDLYDGAWHHIATTFDGTTRKVYVDGCLVGQDTPATILNVPYASNMKLGVTCIPCGGEYYNGTMDEVRIWNYARSACEINNYKKCEIATTAPGLVANYHFNQGTAGGANAGLTTLTDASGYNNHGTLTGFSLSGTASNWVGSGAVVPGFTTPEGVALCLSSITNNTCNGGANGSITVGGNCGTGPYTYDWSPGTPTGDGTATVTALTAGSWTCTVTDALGATGSKSFTITQPATAVTTTALAQTNLSCNGGSNGAASINTPTGGTGGFTYNWTPGNPAGDGTRSVTGLTAGTWTCTVSDATNCTTTQTFTITQPVALSASSSATTIACNGGTAAVTVTATGGTAPYSGYGTFIELEGPYTYTVTDANGCTSNTSITLTEPTALSAGSSATTIACNGELAIVTVTASGGTTPYSGNGTFNELAGSHIYPVTDANGCTSNTSITITEPTALLVNTTATLIDCNGESATITIAATGGTAPYTGEGSVTEFAGTYFYSVTDSNGCQSSSTITIIEPTELIGSAIATEIACNGQTADVTVTASGGTAPYTGDTTSVGVLAGTFTYSVSDANGCVALNEIIVSQPATINLGYSSGSILCNGGTTDLTVTATGGTAPYLGTDLIMEVAGTHTYTVTDANGCEATINATLTEPSLLVATSPATAIICPGNTVDIEVLASGGTAPYTGDGIMNEIAGVQNYTVIDANGCLAFTSTNITEFPAIDVTTTTTDATISANATNVTYQWIDCANNTEIAGATSQSFTATVSGDYAVVLTSNDDCSDTSDCVVIDFSGITEATSINVTVFPNPTENEVSVTMNESFAVIEISDVNGKILLVKTIENNQKISFASYEKGIYLLKITTEKGSALERIVKN